SRAAGLVLSCQPGEAWGPERAAGSRSSPLLLSMTWAWRSGLCRKEAELMDSWAWPEDRSRRPYRINPRSLANLKPPWDSAGGREAAQLRWDEERLQRAMLAADLKFEESCDAALAYLLDLLGDVARGFRVAPTKERLRMVAMLERLAELGQESRVAE